MFRHTLDALLGLALVGLLVQACDNSSNGERCLVPGDCQSSASSSGASVNVVTTSTTTASTSASTSTSSNTSWTGVNAVNTQACSSQLYVGSDTSGGNVPSGVPVTLQVTANQAISSYNFAVYSGDQSSSFSGSLTNGIPSSALPSSAYLMSLSGVGFDSTNSIATGMVTFPQNGGVYTFVFFYSPSAVSSSSGMALQESCALVVSVP